MISTRLYDLGGDSILLSSGTGKGRDSFRLCISWKIHEIAICRNATASPNSFCLHRHTMKLKQNMILACPPFEISKILCEQILIRLHFMSNVNTTGSGNRRHGSKSARAIRSIHPSGTLAVGNSRQEGRLTDALAENPGHLPVRRPMFRLPPLGICKIRKRACTTRKATRWGSQIDEDGRGYLLLGRRGRGSTEAEIRKFPILLSWGKLVERCSRLVLHPTPSTWCSRTYSFHRRQDDNIQGKTIGRYHLWTDACYEKNSSKGHPNC